MLIEAGCAEPVVPPLYLFASVVLMSREWVLDPVCSVTGVVLKCAWSVRYGV